MGVKIAFCYVNIKYYKIYSDSNQLQIIRSFLIY
jgi:hypothetical protein